MFRYMAASFEGDIQKLYSMEASNVTEHVLLVAFRFGLPLIGLITLIWLVRLLFRAIDKL